MSTQTGFDRFVESPEETNENDENLEEWGPTMNHPIPEPELESMFESDGELLDRREIPDSGLSLSDVTDYFGQNREEDRPDRIEQWAEKAAELGDQGAETTAELAADLGDYWEPAGSPLLTPSSIEDLDKFDSGGAGGEYYEIVFANSANPIARAVAKVTESNRDGQDVALETVGNEHIDAPIIDSETIHTKVSRIHSVRPIEEAENTHPDAGAEEQAVATDGGEALEEADDRGTYEPGDTVLVIEDVAVGLMTSPNILEAEVSTSGKSVMIPEDADSINGSRRLDAETIFAGDSEYRDSTGYELYTPGRFRSNQRANHAPGPQAGASSVTDSDELPDPTHWPEGDEPDENPDECPECGASGPWYDVGKPRCEHCGETVDPDAEPEDEETDETPDKWDLSRLETGDTLIIEGHSGEFVVTRVHHFRGTRTVNRLEAAKREGGEWRRYEIEKLDSMEGPRLKVDREGSGADILVNVNDPDHARDFEKTGHDEDKRRRFIRDTRDV